MGLKINRGANGIFETEDLVDAVNYAVAQGADVINLSLAVTNGIRSLEAALKAAFQKEVLVVAAAKNGSGDVGFPAVMAETLSVGDLGDPLEQARDHCALQAGVDLFAPGSGVGFTGPGGIPQTGTGSSFSAPAVSGAAAVLMAMNPNLRPETVMDLLVEGSRAGLEGDGEGACVILSGRGIHDASVPRLTVEAATWEKSAVRIYLPPTDTTSRVYVAVESPGEIRLLAPEGNWVTLSEPPPHLAELPPAGRSVSGILFGEGGLFPPLSPEMGGDEDVRLGVAVTDRSGRLLGPVTWASR